MPNPVQLQDVVEFIADCEHRTAPAVSRDAAYAFSIGTPNIRGGRILLDSARPVDQSTYESWTQRGRPQAEDLILAREAPVGDVGRVNGNQRLCLGQRTVLLRPDQQKVNPRFLHYLLLSPPIQQWMQDRAAGSTVAHLNVEDVYKIDLGATPPLPEQRAIAEVLGALDDKIEANERATSIAKTWVSAAYSCAGEGFVPLSAIARSRHETVDPAPLGETLVDHFSLPAFDAGQRPERTEATSIKSNKLQVPPSSVLMSRLNPRIQRVWRAQVDRGVPALCSTEFLVLQPVDGLTATDIWAVCSDAVVSAELVARTTGTSGSHQRVRPQDAMSVEAPDPRAVPSQVRQCAEAMLTLADSLDVEAALLAQLRDALLPKLLSGELRVRDAETLVEEAV